LPKANHLRILWITPLRALANDTAENLRAAIDGLKHIPWKVELRTGDTSQINPQAAAHAAAAGADHDSGEPFGHVVVALEPPINSGDFAASSSMSGTS
jgi:hypothetical protein